MSEHPIHTHVPTESQFTNNFPATDSEPILVEVIEITPTSPKLTESELTTIPSDIKSNPDWFTIARKLRQQNRELMQTVVKLEKSLTEAREQIQSQKQRSFSTEILVSQQGEELQKTQAQINHLVHELDAAHQTAQRQQLTNENLSEQLANTQEQFAQLQRDCAFLQEECNEKTQKIIFFEQHLRELNARLHRQQRYTLQYKAALNQYLDMPNSGMNSELSGQLSSSSIDQQYLSIPPWSSQKNQDVSLAQSEDNSEFQFSLNLAEQIEHLDKNQEVIDKYSLAESYDFNIDNNLVNNEFTDEVIEDSLNDWLESLDFNELETPETIQTNSVHKWASHVISNSKYRNNSSKIVDLPKFLRGNS